MLKGLNGGQAGRGDEAEVHNWRWDGGSSNQSPSEAAAENWEGRLLEGAGKQTPATTAAFLLISEKGRGGKYSPLLINYSHVSKQQPCMVSPFSPVSVQPGSSALHV